MTKLRQARTIEISAAVEQLSDGMTVGLAGFSYQNPPMAIVREIIRRGLRDLTIVSGPTAGIETDLLIGAGCVRCVVAAGVTLERIAGIAPAFRHHAESGRISVWECDECIWYVALKAGSWGVPYLLWPGGIGTSLPALNEDLREIEEDAKHYLQVPAIRPDTVFLHAPEADQFGNVRASRRAYLGRSFAERALTEACTGPVICTVESIVSNEQVVSGPEWTLLHGALVAEAPWGAHPGGASGRYVPDLEHIRSYATAANQLRHGNPKPYSRYLETFVEQTTDHGSYIELVGKDVLSGLEIRLSQDESS